MTRFQKFLVITVLAIFAGCTKKTPDSPELGQQAPDAPSLGVPALTRPAADSSASVIDTIKSDTTSIPSAVPEPRKKSISKKAKRKKGKRHSLRKRKKSKRYAKRGKRRSRRAG